MKCEIYTKPNCPWCTRAKALLEQHKIPYTEYQVGVGQVTKESIQAQVNSMGIQAVIKTVPQVFYTDAMGKTTYIGGFTDLQAKQAILGT